MRELLQKLMQSFDDSPATSGRLMRELLQGDRAVFLSAAIACLRRAGDTRGFRYLIGLLARNEMLVKCLCDPSLGMETALAVARAASEVYAVLDADLEREVTRGLAAKGGRDAEHAIRALEILGAISSGRRLLPLLTDLLQSPNPRVRSKVARLISRCHRNAHWVEQCRDEADPRVRANAIEGLWNASDDGARQLLWESSRDPNNRVAGNALIGLYRFGDIRAIARVQEMAIRAEPRFRATAAWVMGESADPRFLPLLGRMLADPEKMVRARAFRSVAAIRRRVAELSGGGRIRVHLWEARRLDSGERRLRVTVVDAGELFPPLAGTRFLVTEGAEAVTEYEVKRRESPASLAVGWGLPRGPDASSLAIDPILRECLPHKRPAHQWAILPYNAEPSSGRKEAQVEPRFSASPAVLIPLLEGQASSQNVSSGPLDAARLLVSAAAPCSGERHVVLAASPQDAGLPAAEIDPVIEKARHHGIAIHGLALGGKAADWLESLCGATGGCLLPAATEAETRAATWRTFWGLQYQEEITYRPTNEQSGPTTVRVQVHSDLGIAADCLPLGGSG